MTDEPQDPQVTEPEEPVLPPGVTPRPIEEEMKASYIDYAMSVIVGRALPDVRDGLKPVQRRILYAMHELGMVHNKPYKKCARIVGEVLGKYHPHGDLSVYEALVRMVQDFSLRYPLVQGQGNFGSVDGDNAAAMRYTECRLSRIADELLEDLDKDTVAFGPNFDESLTEPLVLPGRLPNLLVNGASGIAVGMATNIPPHNLSEVVDGLVALIDNPEIPIKDLMKHIKGPDFPTGAMICGKQGIRDAYELGRGSIVVRARIEEEEISGGRTALIVTEIPFQVNKSQLLEQIATLVREKKIEGISDLRDESDRRGMRVVIEIKRDAVPEIVQNQLFHHTPLETKFSANMLAIVGRRPKVLNLKQFLEAYLEHRKDVITRRTRFDLAKAEARAHIVAGLRIAQEHLTRIIKLIRESKDADAARATLMSEFGLSKLQAQAILDMRLQHLTGLERDKLEQEYKNLLAEITRLKGVLADARKVLAVIREEVLELKRSFGDARRTKLTAAAEERDIEDLIQEEEVVVSFSHAGYVKRLPSSTYHTQFRGGKGVTGMTTRDEDFVEDIFVTTTHAHLLLFTNRGRVYWLKVYEIPEAGRAAKGKAIVNLLRLTSPDEKVTAALSIRDFEKEKGHYLLMLTRHGVIKKTPVEEYAHPRSTGIIAIKLSDGDALIDVQMTDGKAAVMLVTKKGMAAYFAEEEIRDIGRVGKGVRGIRLAEGDAVVGMELVGPKDTILTATEGGYGKRSKVEEYRFTHRGAKGVMDIRTSERNGVVVGIEKVTNDDELMLMTAKGMAIRIPAKSVSVIGRATQGVRLVRLEEGDKLTTIARIAHEEIVAGADGYGKGV